MGSNTDAFVVPAGLALRQGDGGMVLEHEGDIVLHGTLGMELAEVRSTGGRIELHIEAELGAVEAAGGIDVNGPLKATKVSAGGDLTINGDLNANAVACGGALTVHGDLEVDDLTADGNVTIEGNVSAQTIASGGALRVGGDLSAQAVSGSEGIRVAGNLAASTVDGGDLTVAGDVKADRVACADIEVGGDLTADAVNSGRLTVGGAAQVDKLDASDSEINGALTCKTVRGGSATIGGAAALANVHIQGALSCAAGLTADTVQAGSASLDGGDVVTTWVRADRSIEVGGVKIKAKVLMAPSITLATETRGKITVLESHNDPGASGVKGCLSIEDLEDLFGNSESFLAELGIAPLGEDAGAPPPVAADDDDDDDDVIEDDDALIDEPADATEDSADSADESAADDAAAAEEDSGDEDSGDEDSGDEDSGDEDSADDESDGDFMEFDMGGGEPASPPEEEAGDADTAQADLEAIEAEGDAPSVEDIFDLEESNTGSESPAPTNGAAASNGEEDDPIFTQMSETVGRIVSCYDSATMPPAVERLQSLVDERDYVGIRDDITNIWNQLLKFHQKKGMRIQPQVTTTFNTINSIVRKL